MEIVCLILSGLCLLALVIVIVLLCKRKTENNNSTLQDLSKDFDYLSEKIKNNVTISMLEQSKKDNELNNDKLERFQKNISDSLNNRFDSLNKIMNDRLEAINKKVDEKLEDGFKNTTESMTQVRERLQAIDSAQKNIESLSKDVVSLKTVLEGNQTRGKYGEYQLDMVLHNIFGDTVGCYEQQYTMKKVKDGDDVRADAVVFMPEPNKMIAIDSKFPFASYEKLFNEQDENLRQIYEKEFISSAKKHITDIKNKYIIDGKTAPEAIMFIPNDGVFAYIHQNCQSLVDYAREVKVILTSPSTLPPILVTINMVRIETERAKNVKEISKQLARLGNDFNQFSKEWVSLSRDLDLASKAREKLDSRVGKITTKFETISAAEIAKDEEEMNVPEIEEQ